MMDFMDVFVNETMVQESVSVVEPEVMTHHADKHVSQARGQVG